MPDITIYAVVEIMGHRTRAGVISDCQVAGATFLRIEHPTEADHTGEEPLTEMYSPSSIFAVRLCSRDEAIEAARYWTRRVPSSQPALPSALDDAYVDDEDDDIVDAEVFG